MFPLYQESEFYLYSALYNTNFLKVALHDNYLLGKVLFFYFSFYCKHLWPQISASLFLFFFFFLQLMLFFTMSYFLYQSIVKETNSINMKNKNNWQPTHIIRVKSAWSSQNSDSEISASSASGPILMQKMRM